MPEEQVAGVSDELDAWLSERATETGRDRAEVLARAVATYRLLSENERSLRENGSGADPLDDRLTDLGDRVDRLERATEEDVADLRDRVVQVLETSQGKADADHDHEGLGERLSEAEAAVASLDGTTDSLDADLTALESALESLASQVDGGFENYEAILEGLADAVDDADAKLDALASAVVDLRERTAALEAADARRETVEELQAEANRLGVGVADCGECGFDVDVALLADPRCPQCATVFDGIDPGRRLFGRATLTVGERPALDGEALETDPADVFEDDD